MTTEVFLKTRLVMMPSRSNSKPEIQFKFSIFCHKVCAILKQFLGTFTTTGMPLDLKNKCPEQGECHSPPVSFCENIMETSSLGTSHLGHNQSFPAGSRKAGGLEERNMRSSPPGCVNLDESWFLTPKMRVISLPALQGCWDIQIPRGRHDTRHKAGGHVCSPHALGPQSLRSAYPITSHLVLLLTGANTQGALNTHLLHQQLGVAFGTFNQATKGHPLPTHTVAISHHQCAQS